MRRIGSVALVGAGPGDPDLITVKGLRRIQECDVVVYDRLIDPRILEEAPPAAERVFAGKAAGFFAMTQRAIELVLIERALAGLQVVRLKGGDPFVFGRGGEEMEALVAAGIPVEVISGVTSAIGVPASAGVPVTHRELSSTLTIVSGHEDPAKEQSAVDWEWLAAGTGTLVVLMGLERLSAIADRLIAAGRAPYTPAAVISAGTWKEERSVNGTLRTIASHVSTARLRSPCTIVIGDVAAFPARLANRYFSQSVDRMVG
jgi:uroporphyrin-III C-methyltransferase